MKRFRHMLIFMLMLFLPFSISSAKEIPDHDSNYYIDELNILSEDTKRLINEQSFEDGEQIFVLTVDNMDDDPQDYAVRAFEKYKLGAKGKDNGLLILLARTSEGKHHVWVTTGYGLEDILPDGKVGRIIDDYMMDSFYNGDLNEGMKKGFIAFSKILLEKNVFTENSQKVSEEQEDNARDFYSRENYSYVEDSDDNIKRIISRNFPDFMFLFFLLFMLTTFVLTILTYFIDLKVSEKMNYEDFLLNKKRGAWNFEPYKKRLKKITVNKKASDIEKDINKATTFKKLLIEIYKEKRKEELINQGLDDLLSGEPKKAYEKKIYEELISEKLEELFSDTLINLMRQGCFSFYKSLFFIEYRKRFKKSLSNSSLEELIEKKNLYKDEFLNDEEVESLIEDKILRKTRRVSERQLRDLQDTTTDLDVLRILKKEIRDRERDDDDSWNSSSSFGSFGGSSSWSSGGGFSGGGGSTGGGGAGRSF